MAKRPVLGQRRRARRTNRSRRPKQLFVVGLVAVGVYLWVTEIGGDLAGPQRSVAKPKRVATKAKRSSVGGKHLTQQQRIARRSGRATGTTTPGSAIGRLPAVIRPAGPTAPRLPARGGLAAAAGAGGDPAAAALLATARDHVARGVIATVGSVPDIDAVKGSSPDLIERGLHQIGFPLRTAVLLHRYREPQAYGLRRRPRASDGARRRVLSVRNLRVFLDRFARRLSTEWRVASLDSYLPGDIVLVSRPGRRDQLAIVGERTNEEGVSLLYTLDPREHTARADHALADFKVIAHYRLHRAELARVRGVLPVPRPRRTARR